MLVSRCCGQLHSYKDQKTPYIVWEYWQPSITSRRDRRNDLKCVKQINVKKENVDIAGFEKQDKKKEDNENCGADASCRVWRWVTWQQDSF